MLSRRNSLQRMRERQQSAIDQYCSKNMHLNLTGKARPDEFIEAAPVDTTSAKKSISISEPEFQKLRKLQGKNTVMVFLYLKFFDYDDAVLSDRLRLNLRTIQAHRWRLIRAGLIDPPLEKITPSDAEFWNTDI